MLGLVALLCLGTMALGVVVLVFADRWPFGSEGLEPPSSMTTAQPSESALAPAPTASPPAATIRPEPQAVTLQVTDLPPGYHVLKTGPALFSPNAGEATPASWDVVFAPDTSRQTGYLLVESAVAVYADTEAAVAAVKTEDEAEESVHALRQVSVPGLGNQQAVWIEPAPDRPGYGIVRVTWQSLNVVGQVSVLGLVDSSQPLKTAQLAMVEQNRIQGAMPQGTESVAAVSRLALLRALAPGTVRGAWALDP